MLAKENRITSKKEFDSFFGRDFRKSGGFSASSKAMVVKAIVTDDKDCRVGFIINTKIDKKAVSFHEHSGADKLNWAIDELKGGKNIVFLTDAGTPNLSDPGGKLVEAANGVQIKISPIPGPSALTALISVAPFSCQEFVFKGYFPKKKGREKMIKTIQGLDMPIFFFESPYRIQKTIKFLRERLPDYKILIGRELTKRFEQIIYCHLTDGKTLEKIVLKGEFVFALVKIRN